MRPSPVVRIIAGLVYAFMLIPLVVIMLFSFSEKSYFSFPPSSFSLKWYVRAWESGLFLMPALRSLALGVLATLIAAGFAVSAALAMRALRQFRVTRVIEFFFLSPLIVPHLILGIALLHYFNAPGLIDRFEGLLAAHIIIVFPFLFRTVLVSVQELNPQLEEASELMGAGKFTTFRLVVLPALTPGIAAGAILAFIVSFDQFTISLLITQREQITLPVAIYKYLYDVNDPVAAAVSTALVVVGFSIALVVQRFSYASNLPRG